MRATLYVALSLAALSCSSGDPSGGEAGLTRIWSTPVQNGDIQGQRAGADADRFYVIYGAYMHAYSAADGVRAWTQRITNVCAPILSSGGRVLCPNDAFEAFDAASGRPLWRFEPPSATFLIVDGAAGGGLAFGGTPRGTTVYALDAATGAVAWQKRLAEPEWRGGGMRGLAVSGDTVFASLTRSYNENAYLSAAVVVALDRATGRELWRFQDGDGSDSRSTIGGVTVSGRTVLYASNNGGEYTAFDRETRQVRWRVKEDPGFVGPYQAPTVVGGVAYGAGGDKNVYAIDVATGAIRWKVSPQPFTYWSHAVCGSLVLADNRSLNVVDRATGRTRGVLFSTPEESVKSVNAVGTRAFVATNKAVYGFECPP